MFVAGPMVTFVSHKNDSDLPLYCIRTLILFFTVAGVRIILGNHNSVTFGSIEACFITIFEIIPRSSKNHFQNWMRENAFLGNQKAIEDLVNHVATILGKIVR
jgi:hypothetical protein